MRDLGGKALIINGTSDHCAFLSRRWFPRLSIAIHNGGMRPRIPQESFSKRFGVRPKPPSRKPDEVPDSARIALLRLIDEERGSRGSLPGAYSLAPRLSEAVGKIPEGPGDIQKIKDLIYGLEWWEFYDACEALPSLCRRSPEKLAHRIESLFASEGLPYKMTPHGIEWRLSEPARGIVDETTQRLVEAPAFQGAAEQWGKARRHLTPRPPDAENCIKDAVGALEGVARIISKRHGTLGKTMPALAQELDIHSCLAGAMSKLYAYRGDEEAVAHGATKRLEDRTAEAELVLHWCAAAIVYLVKKREDSR